jgi:hypothetical protein
LAFRAEVAAHLRVSGITPKRTDEGIGLPRLRGTVKTAFTIWTLTA